MPTGRSAVNRNRGNLHRTLAFTKPRPARVDRRLMWKALIASATMSVLFFAGSPVPKVAVVVGALLLITRRVNPEKVYRRIDWSLLVMFVGLLDVVAGEEKTSLEKDLATFAGRIHLENVYLLRLSRLCFPIWSVMLRPCWDR
jgi:Na+/H+ antiporter NhaD/arsenite permease-like protein